MPRSDQQKRAGNRRDGDACGEERTENDGHRSEAVKPPLLNHVGVSGSRAQPAILPTCLLPPLPAAVRGYKNSKKPAACPHPSMLPRITAQRFDQPTGRPARGAPVAAVLGPPAAAPAPALLASRLGPLRFLCLRR
jgi:hypothetical protein